MLNENLLTLLNIVRQLKTFSHGCQLILDSGVPAEYLAYHVKDIPPVLRKLSIDIQHALRLVKTDTMTYERHNFTAKGELRALLLVTDDLSDELYQAFDLIGTAPGDLISDSDGNVETLRDVYGIHIECLDAVTRRCYRVESVLHRFIGCLSTPSNVDQTFKDD